MRSECQSVRGEWGKQCPDCGATLPERPRPMSSWKSGRPIEVAFGTVSGRRWSQGEYESRMASNRERMTDRQSESLRMLAKHAGNVAAAARELGIAAPTMHAMVKRLREKGVYA